MASTVSNGNDRSEKWHRPFQMATTVYEREICVTDRTFNHPVYDNCVIYGYMLFYIPQKCALIIDVILKRDKFLSTSVSRNIDFVSITNELSFLHHRVAGVNRFK